MMNLRAIEYFFDHRPSLQKDIATYYNNYTNHRLSLL